MAYSCSEMADMHLMYGLSDGNGHEARRLYQERFPQRRIPHHTTFAAIDRRVRERGSFQEERPGRPRNVATPQTEHRILARVARNPRISIRTLARLERISHTTVWNILHCERLYPYHFQRVQALSPHDFPFRMQFCQWFLGRLNEDPYFSSLILFTDESTFTRDGIVNFHNTHLWTEINPHGTISMRHQNKFSLNVWAGIVGDMILGPYFLPTRLNGATYLEFLSNNLCEMLEDVNVQTRMHIWYMHDGAPAHFHCEVRAYLREHYPRRWIGRGGPVSWPPRSPDLNPLDFYLWGHLKSIVYGTEVATAEELRLRIENGFIQIRNSPGICERIRTSLTKRLQSCIQSGGGHFEHLL